MRGVVLAAGQGQRLRPDTDRLPKTLLPVDGDTTILDIALRNLVAAGAGEIAIVVGFASEAIERRHEDLKRRYGVDIRLIHNDRVDWNNAYSLWNARDFYAEGALLVNGDTVHPGSVEKTLLAAEDSGVLLATDAVKTLTDEAMKVRVDSGGVVKRVTKQMPVDTAYGEYIGVSRLGADVTAALTEALERTWRNDPNLYYEDAFQLLADAGPHVHSVPIGTVEWVEVDDHADWATAREVACRC
ncbi:MAG TPA: phosphocholine cytidylyltransferase family protein [Stackebrandtia sp.]|uniref:phosphocholine cytidylyltransferase family protein n=1 Tax=Stackebrandtia sp. TaxID=2023065 RepID=UPI002D2CC033|nr:phosphocholine cytidylyltransferase family protein [Stackebrandtia sp.]HZE37887.1 phosphocholine cytidylyltransferase family protein [Stackebrandtia sp.]